MFDQQWDALFAPLLAKEPQIHKAAFGTYVWAKSNGITKYPSFEAFKTHFSTPAKSIWAPTEVAEDKVARETALKSVYLGYWLLAIRHVYWQDSKVGQTDGWFEYMPTIDVWNTEEAAIIQDWKDDLSTWRSAN